MLETQKMILDKEWSNLQRGGREWKVAERERRREQK